ncbi:hypothetical protein ADEAN_000567500 [Angomonas deanei]|uniref:PLAC8 family n=1 Tax=Angomonas deanei TaxID=59799 RepID=A0A7G2CE99_9TRYP|nr:hypothetical protein ADEAN_000567500 [Angomonas deanei]
MSEYTTESNPLGNQSEMNETNYYASAYTADGTSGGGMSSYLAKRQKEERKKEEKERKKQEAALRKQHKAEEKQARQAAQQAIENDSSTTGDPNSVERFHTDLTDCCLCCYSDTLLQYYVPDICSVRNEVIFCYCCQLSRQYNILYHGKEEQHIPVCFSTALFSCLLWFNPPGIYFSYQVRRRVRLWYHLMGINSVSANTKGRSQINDGGEKFKDCCLVMWCPCCVLAQDLVEMAGNEHFGGSYFLEQLPQPTTASME